MRQRHTFRCFGPVSALGLIGACSGGSAPTTPPPEPSDQCAIVVQIGAVPDTIAVAVTQEISAYNAPLPTNDAERLAFRQLYENLVTFDCTGRVSAGIAESWNSSEGGRVWAFTIRADARFWDGSRVTAADVRSSWLSDRTTAMGVSIRAVTIVSDRSLNVTFNESHDTLPTMLAHPAFAVVKNDPAHDWPLGTGHYRLSERSSPTEDLQRDVVVRPAAMRADRSRPVLRFVRVGQTDVRDMLDRDLDIVMTGDSRVIEYADRDERFTTIPLSWDRTYVMFSQSVGSDTALAHRLINQRSDLATRAVTGEARGAADWFGTTVRETCELVLAAPGFRDERSARNASSNRIVFAQRDVVARSLAERVVAQHDLTANDRERRPRLTAAPLARNQFADALERGDEFGYIVALPRRTLAPCRDLQTVLVRAPWLGFSNDIEIMTVPLVDTRPRLIVRNRVGDITAEWDGALVFYDGPKQVSRSGGENE